MAKHTPGPWITFQPRGDGSVPVRTDGLGLTICYVHDGAICDARINALLIAAAPDMLAAVQARREARVFAASVSAATPDGEKPEKHLMDKADLLFAKAAQLEDAAIAKAEGRSNV